MIDNTVILVMESLPGFIVFGCVTFILASAYLWSTAHRPTRYDGLRYHMVQDKVPQIALAMLILIGACMLLLSVKTPALLIPTFVVMLAALLSALAVHAVLNWLGRLQQPPRPDQTQSSTPAPLPVDVPSQSQLTSAEAPTQTQR